MSRSTLETQRRSSEPILRQASAPLRSSGLSARAQPTGIFLAGRVLFVAAMVVAGYAFRPFHLNPLFSMISGFAVALAILLAELRLRDAEASGLAGGALGALVGIFAALLTALILSRTEAAEPAKSFLECAALLSFGYLGLALGAQKGFEFRASSITGPAVASAEAPPSIKLLDTSVLIDGRIADICDAHFLDGILIVPMFVLHELQLVADSGDTLKRQRGRRGLEVLQRIQKMPHVDVRINNEDLPQSGDVDHKLVELAKRTGAKVVTNDFNLNKVATVQGVEVMNINQLANALKPAVLPGEPMRVLILREGKEANQGVAYLDDGTMVVVDGARRLINKTVDIVVTSVHQTTAGKMIFGRLDERSENSPPQARSAAASMRSDGGASIRPEPRTENGGRSGYTEPDIE